MIKYNLKCDKDHEFESWFSDSEEFDKLNKKKLLECIFCSSKKIKKSIMAPMISNLKIRDEQSKIFNNEFKNEKKELLNQTFNSSIDNLKEKFGENPDNWVYGQENFKHVKIYHPLEKVVNDSIKDIIGLKSYPRGGDGYTPGSTSNSLNQRSGGSFRVMIDTGNWDNSYATNSPGQSGDPDSKFYDNLYEDWANDVYFPLLFSKSKVLLNLSERTVFKPKN